MGQSNELGEEPTGEVAKWDEDERDDLAQVAVDPDYRSIAIDATAELDQLKDSHGAALVRENTYIRKLEAIAAALTGTASMHEKLEAVYTALHG